MKKVSAVAKKRNRSWIQVARPLVQGGFVAFILIAAIRNGLGLAEASTHAYCPFGVIASFWPLVTTGAFAPKIHLSSAVLGAGVLISALFVGGAFCGWVCPLGALEDALIWVRRKLRLRELVVPAKLDAVLRYGRFVVLIGIIYATAVTAKLWFADYDPYYTIFGLGWIFEFDWTTQWRAYVTALAIIGGSLFIPRLWCRYLCPLGGLMSLLQRISPIKIRRNAPVCISCKRCDRVCPTRLNVSTAGAVTHDCVMCLQCVESCPAAGALEVALPGYEKQTLGKEQPR
jgi:polyferredoxin